MKVAIIGAGNMGGAIARGLAQGTIIPASDVTVADPFSGSLETLQADYPEINVTTENPKAIKDADIVILAVKPWLIDQVLSVVHLTPRQVLVSIAGGVTFEQLVKSVGPEQTIFRLIPNTAISQLESMTLISSRNASKEQEQLMLDIFNELGLAMLIPESQMAATTALTSCGIAYVLKYIQAAMQAGIELGIYPKDAQKMVAQSVKGAASLILNNDTHPSVEIDKVCTPGGMTIKGINEFAASFNLEFPKDIKAVAYKSDNQITNIGNESWNKETGLISVWMLSMFNPTSATTVFIPYKQSRKGKIVNDEYFGKIPTDRLIVKNGIIYFKIDGCFRSKLGVPASRATNLCGSYDSSKGVLTILWCDIFEDSLNYMNGQWGIQNDPYYGDVINAYNDGPVEDGSVMGPFYEIETSSPGAELAPNESLTHTQKIIHIQGNDKQLDYIIKKLFKTDIYSIKTKFQ